MILQKMYPPQKDSPGTFLSGDITAMDTLINVGSSFILPQTAPYPLTLGFDKSITETVIVTDIGSGNNQLTVERPEGALFWPAGTKCARVFTADDLQSIQTNVRTIAGQSDTDHDLLAEINPQVESNTTAIGDLEDVLTGMVGEVATDLSTEVVRATGVESTLDANKINRSELPQVITNWVYSADGSALLVTITRYNASNKTTSEFTKTIPLVNSEAVGAMTPEAYNEITTLRNDVNSLINQGGRFIGVSFASKSGLDSYIVPTTVKMGDYTYVLDDETHDDALTRYIYSGESWDFSFVINYDPVGLADSTTPGLVKSDGGSTDGKVFVETDGSMSVIGWDDLNSAINTITGDALIPGTQGGIGDIIPTNADLLGGKDKGYFEALVDAVSQRVTENLTAINELNNNFAQGVWTPSLEGESTKGTFSATTIEGSFTKSGKVVIASFGIAGVLEGASGVLIIRNLPITAKNLNQTGLITRNIIDGVDGSVLFVSTVASKGYLRLVSANSTYISASTYNGKQITFIGTITYEAD